MAATGKALKPSEHEQGVEGWSDAEGQRLFFWGDGNVLEFNGSDGRTPLNRLKSAQLHT